MCIIFVLITSPTSISYHVQYSEHTYQSLPKHLTSNDQLSFYLLTKSYINRSKIFENSSLLLYISKSVRFYKKIYIREIESG
jgi:hypothetical protein